MVKTWETLVQLLSVGDKEVYVSVFREFYGPLVVYARPLVGDRDISSSILMIFLPGLRLLR